jgi:hypothetical protein
MFQRQWLGRKATLEELKLFNDLVSVLAIEEAFNANEPLGANRRYRFE